MVVYNALVEKDRRKKWFDCHLQDKDIKAKVKVLMYGVRNEKKKLKYADKGPRLLPSNIDDELKAYQIQVLAQGVLDAFVLCFFESSRAEDKQSTEWLARQNRKIDGGFKAFEELVKNRKGDYLVANTYSIADIAVVCSVGQVNFGGLRPNWKEDYPQLASWWEQMDAR